MHKNDPLGQTHSPASNDHYFHLKVVLFCEILQVVMDVICVVLMK